MNHMKANLNPRRDDTARTGARSRREFLRVGGMAALALAQADAWGASDATDDVRTPFFAFDREVQRFMQARNIPGGALAVVKDRRLVYTHAYGWADRERKIPTTPGSLFRVASISKPFTAVAVLKLVEERKLSLEAPIWGLLDLPSWVPGGKIADERWRQITVRHVLHHTGGWDRDKSFDPMFRSHQIATSFGLPSPPAPRLIIRYMLGQPLDFDPGTRYAYSNFGYCVLGRVIEAVTGTNYETFVQKKVLAPIGIKRMRVGASLVSKRAVGEVRYYTPDDGTAESVFEVAKQVSWPYGGFCLESMDAHGGWIASAVDLARFAAAFYDAEHSPLLKPEMIQIMHRPPAPPVWRNDDGSLKDYYYGCGWLVRPAGKTGKGNYWHTGSLPGTYTLLVRRQDGISWVILFNQRSDDTKLPDGEIDPALHRAANAVTEWPKSDLFLRSP